MSETIHLPFEDLKKVGDHFFVVGHDYNLAHYAHHQSKKDGRIYMTRRLRGGAIVVLVDGPNLQPKRVLRLPKKPIFGVSS